MEELLGDPVVGKRVDLRDIESTITAICASADGGDWERDVEVILGIKRWRPSAVSNDRRRLLYVFLQEELPRFVKDRLLLAAPCGIAVTVALPIAALYKPDVTNFLASIEADVLVVDDYDDHWRLKPRNILTALTDVGVPLSPESRREIGRSAWAKIGEGTAQERGRRLEALLAFLFAQVNDLKVLERNYRTETEEIDLVLQIDNFSPRVWQKSGVPFILVEAKNRVEKASQQMISVLLTKLQTNRGTSRIAFLVSLAGFTEDAKLEELRFSIQEMCVVMIGREELESLIEADNLDDTLETMVSHALMR